MEIVRPEMLVVRVTWFRTVSGRARTQPVTAAAVATVPEGLCPALQPLPLWARPEAPDLSLLWLWWRTWHPSGA